MPDSLLNAETRFCAVYGHPIRHSASPPMQNAALGALGLNWRYLAFDVHPDNLAAALQGAKAMKFIGLNLTVPHKLLALSMVDGLDESARVWGAVNTIRFEARMPDNSWRPLGQTSFDQVDDIRAVGFNTDAEGLILALKDDLNFQPRGRSALLLGAGGAGRVAALKLAAEGVAELYLVNRTPSKAEALADEIKERWPDVKCQTGYPPAGVDLVINATSLGLKPGDALPFDPAAFSLRSTGALYDMIYRPAETALLKAAQEAGCETANGLSMLLHQGARALEIWTGTKAPLEVMSAALREAIYGRPAETRG